MDDAGKTVAVAPDLPQPAGPGRPPSTTRHQLQDIAIDMFSAHGYDEVTIEALAAAAGISRRTFFRYFSSKADALMADFDTAVERLRSGLAGQRPGSADDGRDPACCGRGQRLPYRGPRPAAAAHAIAARQPGPAGQRHPALRGMAGRGRRGCPG